MSISFRVGGTFTPGAVQAADPEVKEWVEFCVKAVSDGAPHPKYVRDFRSRSVAPDDEDSPEPDPEPAPPEDPDPIPGEE